MPKSNGEIATSSFTQHEFRSALGLLPTGVAVVTTLCDDERKIGITVNSFTSVSLNPPLVSFNLDKRLQSLPVWLDSKAFAINFLTEEQDAVSSTFARAQIDKWLGTDSKPGVTSSPVFHLKLAAFECEKFACHEAGDHFIMIGRVLHFEVEDSARPLLFHRGLYRKLGELLPARTARSECLS